MSTVVIMGLCLLVAQLSPTSADPLDHWTSRHLFPTNAFGTSATHWDVTFGHGIFVAVGHQVASDFGTIYSSPDGVTWTPRHSLFGTFGELRRVVFIDGRFLAVGWNYAISRSDDGITWQNGFAPGLSTGLSGGFQDICFGQGKFVAVDGEDRESVLTSVDGESWTRQGVPRLRPSLRLVCFGDGKFVTVGVTFRTDQDPPAFVSADGIDWNPVSIPGPANLWSLTWAKNLFVAVGNAGTNPAVAKIFTSPDGNSWTVRDLGFTNQLGSVRCINGLFIATGDSVLLTSNNGIDWETRASTNRVTRFTYGHGTLVGISGGLGYAYWGRGLSQTASLIDLRPTNGNPGDLSITGIHGQTCRIESTDELLNAWEPVGTVLLQDGPSSWVDPVFPRPTKRFYRAVWSPPSGN